MQITLFKSPQCPGCKTAEELLLRKGIDFEVVDITKSQDALDYLTSRGSMAVPSLQVNGQLVTGFRQQLWQDTIESELERERL